MLYHRTKAQRLARRIYKLKEKLEKHLAFYYVKTLEFSHRVGKDPKEDEYYINRIMRL